MNKNILYAAIVLIFLFNACSKQTETFNTPAISEYSPLVIGKYITYNLDSLVFTNFGSSQDIVNYQVKYVVEDTVTDNLGRNAFLVRRYIRQVTVDSTWQPDNAFMAINTGKSFEFIEDNLRYIKLMQPIRDDYSWKGNIFIQVIPSADPASSYPDLSYLDDWDYTYQNVNQPLVLGSYNLDSTIIVNQRNEVLNDTSNPAVYSEVNFGQEKYAKGIGMVYRKFLHREWQPATTGTNGYALGYGVTLTMIDHN
jgi:hypothetical protein